jgi:hypothetical protein
MAFERKNHTQSMGNEPAQIAFDRLVRDLGVPKSVVLQAILEAVPTSDLVALVRGDLALCALKSKLLSPFLGPGSRTRAASVRNAQWLSTLKNCWARRSDGDFHHR